MVRVPFHRTVLGLLGALVAVFAWAQAPTPPDGVIDLGKREVGKAYPFSLIAQNLNCSQPQDFKFVINGNGWLKIPGDPVAHQIGKGQQKSVPAQLDFTRLPPGRYTAQVTIVCDTCQFLVFANCKISDRQMLVQIEAVAPPPPQVAAQPPARGRGPVSAARPSPGGAAAPSVQADFDPELAFWLTRGQKQALDDARRRSADAAMAAKKAADDLESARKKKGPCEEELAALRAAAATAAEAAAAAESAANAAAASDAAGQAAADNDKALSDAEKAMDAAQKRLENAAAARSRLARDGANASAMAAAQAAVDAANDAAYQAQKAFMAARAAAAPDKAAADKAAAEADAASAASSEAAAKLAAAQAALAAKEAECGGLAAAEAAAQSKADAAAAAAATAAAAEEATRKKAGEEARAAAILSLEDQLARARQRCEDIYNSQLANAKKQEKALAALQKLGAIGPNAPTTGLVSMWSDWGGWATGVATQGAAVAGGFAAGGKGIPTAGGPQMILGALQAAYGIFQIRAATLTPNTKAFLTDRAVYGQNSQANQWVRSNGFADDKAEGEAVLDEMERILNDTDVMAKDMANAASALNDCKAEVAALEAKLAAAKGG